MPHNERYEDESPAAFAKRKKLKGKARKKADMRAAGEGSPFSKTGY